MNQFLKILMEKIEGIYKQKKWSRESISPKIVWTVNIKWYLPADIISTVLVSNTDNLQILFVPHHLHLTPHLQFVEPLVAGARAASSSTPQNFAASNTGLYHTSGLKLVNAGTIWKIWEYINTTNGHPIKSIIGTYKELWGQKIQD